MKPTNPTSRDIADAAGVSQATVSRALRDSPLVRQETREHIQKIAQELGYSVNRNAASLRSQSSQTIALLLFDEADGNKPEALINPFYLSMLSHITRAAAAFGYDVLVSLQELAADWHIEYQASYRADGLILLGYGDYESYQPKLDALTETNAQYVIWGPMIESQPGRSFGCDNETGGYLATQHLTRLGCQNIAFIGDTTRNSPELADRHRGYRNALEEAGHTYQVDLAVAAHNAEEQGFHAMNQLIDAGIPFDSVFAVTDLLAIGAIRALQARDLRVPEDIRVVGFDDIELAAYVSPALTTVRQNTAIAGEELVRRLVRLIEGQNVDSTQMQPELVVRDSCGSRR
ncbi:MAG: LacI family DNA-binding transcriptional regulator [Pseudomonadota bacterium]